MGCVLVGVEDLASLANLEYLLIGVGFGGLLDGLGGLSEEDAFAPASRHGGGGEGGE